MIKFLTYEELLEQVEKNAGIVIGEMASLRDAYGAGKLGVHVIRGIEEKLASLGLGHSPLTVNQFDRVRIFGLGGQIGRIIRAAHNIDEESDEVLRKASSNNDSEIVRRVRELVCD